MEEPSDQQPVGEILDADCKTSPGSSSLSLISEINWLSATPSKLFDLKNPEFNIKSWMKEKNSNATQAHKQHNKTKSVLFDIYFIQLSAFLYLQLANDSKVKFCQQ